jgi:Phage tail assembly chaperone protein, TAC
MTSPWLAQAAVATGLMGWRPDEFWSATPVEFFTAWRGWLRAQGHIDAPQVTTHAELARLMKAFPDD